MLMRTRSRTRNSTVLTYWAKALDGTIATYNFGPGTESTIRTIIDDPLPSDKEKYVKDVYTATRDNVLTPWYHGGYRRGSNPNTWEHGLASTLPIMRARDHAVSAGLTSRCYPTASNQWRLQDVPASVTYDAFERLLPRVNDGFSLINFILELKDLRRMFNVNSLEYLMQKFGAQKPKELGRNLPFRSYNEFKTYKDKVKGASDDYLNYFFGWKPLISDIQSMRDLIAKFDKKMAYIESHAGRVIRRNTSTLLTSPSLPVPGNATRTSSQLFNTVMFDQNSHVCPIYTSCRWVYQPRYHMTLVYSYSLPNVSAWRRKLRGWLDAFGVRFDPSVIWNAIPFSFVVDWILDIGSELRAFAPNDLGMNIVIHDASHSVKWHTIGYVTADLPHYNLTKYTQAELWSEERSYYERAPWIPKLRSVEATVPGALQFSLGGALVLSDNKRRFRRG